MISLSPSGLFTFTRRTKVAYYIILSWPPPTCSTRVSMCRSSRLSQKNTSFFCYKMHLEIVLGGKTSIARIQSLAFLKLGHCICGISDSPHFLLRHLRPLSLILLFPYTCLFLFRWFLICILYSPAMWRTPPKTVDMGGKRKIKDI